MRGRGDHGRGLRRREWLRAGGLGIVGLSLPRLAAARAALPAAGRPRANACLVIFLSGGLSQHESFDPKPDGPLDIRGEFAAIPTRSAGVRICEHLRYLRMMMASL